MDNKLVSVVSDEQEFENVRQLLSEVIRLRKISDDFYYGYDVVTKRYLNTSVRFDLSDGGIGIDWDQILRNLKEAPEIESMIEEKVRVQIELLTMLKKKKFCPISNILKKSLKNLHCDE